jgi:peptidoglycan hydrolase CwlO-like protein
MINMPIEPFYEKIPRLERENYRLEKELEQAKGELEHARDDWNRELGNNALVAINNANAAAVKELHVELAQERALTGQLTAEIGKRDGEIAGLRLSLSEIVICCDEGGTHGRIREIALDALGEAGK